FAAMERLLELRAICDDPPVNGGVIHLNPTFLHELFDMARTQRIRHIPADAGQSNLLWKVGSLEAHSHGLSPSVFTLSHQGRSYLKWSHMKIATEPEIYQVIDNVGGWAGGAARQNGMEAWRLVFRPDLPTIERVVELTEDSF